MLDMESNRKGLPDITTRTVTPRLPNGIPEAIRIAEDEVIIDNGLPKTPVKEAKNKHQPFSHGNQTFVLSPNICQSVCL